MLDSSNFKEFNLSPAEQEACLQVVKNISDIWKEAFNDAEYFLKWMRARKFVVSEVTSMIRNDHEWRRTVDADHVLEKEASAVSEVMDGYWPGGLCGEDKHGRPVYVMPFGQVDLGGLANSVRKSEQTKYICWFMENFYRVMRKKSEKTGKKINQVTMIFDMEGFTMRHITYKPGVDGFIHCLLTMEDHYPETISSFIIVNAPTIFSVAYTLISPFITDIMKSKIHLLGANYKEELLKFIDADHLPVFYGGAKVDEHGDPKCQAEINFAGVVPSSYYMAGQMSVPASELESGVVARGYTLQLDYVVEKSGTILRWEFMTQDYDIGFGVYRRTKAGQYQHAQDMEVVVATERFNTHMVPEYGSYTCNQAGTYVLRFDNTYSWVTNKTVLYKVDVIEPSDCTELVQGMTDINLCGIGGRLRKQDLFNTPSTVI